MSSGDEGVTRSPPAAGRPAGWLIWVVVVATLAAGFFFLLRPDTPLSPDAREYVQLAMRLADHGELRLATGEVAKRAPLYPAFLAGVYRWQGGDPTAAQNLVLLLQSLMWVGIAALIALIAARIGGERAGLIAGLIAALYSPFHELQMSFLSETLLIFLLAPAVWIYLRSGAPRFLALGIVSAIVGLATLVRPNAALVLLAILVEGHWRFRQSGWNRRLVAVGCMVVPFVCCVAPWAIRNHRVLGGYTLSTTSGLNFYLGHNARYAEDPGLGRADYGAFDRLRREEGLSEREADRRLFEEGLRFVGEHPAETMANLVRKTRVWVGSNVTASAPSLTLIGLAAMASAGWGAWRRGRLDGARRMIWAAALALLVPVTAVWALSWWRTSQPWVSPVELVPFGLAALLFASDRIGGERRLLMLLFVSQWVAALLFIPLVRIRWTVDLALIIAVGVGIARWCEMMAGRRTHASGR